MIVVVVVLPWGCVDECPHRSEGCLFHAYLVTTAYYRRTCGPGGRRGAEPTGRGLHRGPATTRCRIPSWTVFPPRRGFPGRAANGRAWAGMRPSFWVWRAAEVGTGAA